MRVLVTGVNGQLGYDVVCELQSRGHNVLGVDVDEMDITQETAVRSVIQRAEVDSVVHCAAYTAVDMAEDNAKLCHRVNTLGTKYIAKICKKLDIKMIYISTDYVFDGHGNRPWEPNDKRKPLNIYGKTKYKGELVVQKYLKKYYIVRTSWVFGANGKNFVKTMLNLGKTKGNLSVVADQIGSPTYTYDLAKLLADMLGSERYGIYHATNEGFCSWYEFACEIFKMADMNVKVTPINSSTYNVKAKRPLNSRMNNNKLVENGFYRLPDWRDALRRYLLQIKI